MSSEISLRRAVFLDRDGVLMEDVDLVTRAEQIRPLPGAAAALRKLRDAGFLLIVVTNQPVVARGMATEAEVAALNTEMARRLAAEGAPAMDAMYFCPHHPRGSVAEYRIDCECRKPRPGMLRRAAAEWSIDLAASFMVGDRPTDMAAGAAVGCRTIWVQTGKHHDPPISTTTPFTPVKPDWVCADLAAAADWILARA